MKYTFFLVFLLVKALTYGNASVNMLKEKISIFLPHIPGWCSQEKANAFVDLILDVKPKVYVEIGVFYGSSLYPVASALKFLNNGIVIGIDPWDYQEAIKNYDPNADRTHVAWWLNVNMEHAYSSCMIMLKNFQLDPYCKIFKQTAQEAANEIDLIDILYLDGNQSEASSLLDVSLYLPKVVSGGYIWMNNPLNVQSQTAIDLIVKECDIIKVIENGNCVLFKKRNP